MSRYLIGSFTEAVAVATLPNAVDEIDRSSLIPKGITCEVQVLNLGGACTWIERVQDDIYLTNNEHAAGETEMGGAITLFCISKDNEITILGKKAVDGDAPTHLTLDRVRNAIYASNYTSGSLSTVGFDFHSLKFSEEKPEVIHHGSSSHVHQSVLDTKNNLLTVVDLGLDCVRQYRLSMNASKIVSEPFVSQISFPKGFGPRHIAFHPTQPFAFVLHELRSKITTLGVDCNGLLYSLSDDDTFEDIYTVSSLLSDQTEVDQMSAAEVVIHGDLLVVSNRDISQRENNLSSIGIYKIEVDKVPVLHRVSERLTSGNHPRHFHIRETKCSDRFELMVPNQESHDIVIFEVMSATGEIVNDSIVKFDISNSLQRPAYIIPL